MSHHFVLSDFENVQFKDIGSSNACAGSREENRNAIQEARHEERDRHGTACGPGETNGDSG